MQFIFATNNKHKLHEVREAVGERFKIISLDEAGIKEDIPETGITLEENAKMKAQYIFDKYHENCFADDTGLEIDAIDGRPGVYSARYAGEGCNFEDNMIKVLEEMKGRENRKARFRCVVALIINGEVMSFEGRVEGNILTRERGNKGFGYDPIFIPEGYDITFAEMSLEEKNKISHRGKAIHKLTEYLLSQSF
ncbi:MAG TPA: non-canonical purine NTP diphosphatase [Bacteroidales bacterium]|nr:non-canonical purine NTP diphosphatase [Bacteroidales bacterium]HPS15932.1 non-canonical purine NTP diphosphatase [Bacteroidales bacterium]